MSRRDQKARAAGRAMLMQGLLTQAGLAVIILLLAALSRGQPRMFWGFIWSLIVPAGIAAAFLHAHARSRRPEATPGAEAREAKRALLLTGGVMVAWIVGLGLILFL